MVLLTMTPSIVDGLEKLRGDLRNLSEVDAEGASGDASLNEPSMSHPAVGQPISHSQIVRLWKRLGASGPSASEAPSLEQLLKGSFIYIPPPPPKPEKSDEYKALMARLRLEEEERAYERLINPPRAHEPPPNVAASAVHAFAEVNRPSTVADVGDDEVTMNEVHRQVTLIINFLLSIAGVAATLWIAGRWWSTPSRLFLTMGGSLVVAIAEVAVYSGYMWRLEKSKQKQGAVREVKQVVKTWVVGQDTLGDDIDGVDGIQSQEHTVLPDGGRRGADDENLRRRQAARPIDE